MPHYQSHQNYQNKSKKVALVTRAANDIGKANIIEFGRAGYTIMINDTSEQELKQAAEEILNSLSQYGGAEVSYFLGDISKEEVSISLIEETIKRFGRIDVLINNAIISQQLSASQSYEMSAAATGADANTSTNYQESNQSSPYFTLEEYTIMDINLKGIYFCIRELAKQLSIHKNLDSNDSIKKHNSRNKIDFVRKVDCSIINIAPCYKSIPDSQTDAYTVSQPEINPSSSSRSNIKSLTESVALQLADLGIRVNAIAPGIIDSEVRNGLQKDKEKINQIVQKIPFRRIGQAQEIAKVVLFLASEASSYVTGTMIYSDGGLSLRESRSP